jgi:hypothetical protein
VARYPASWFSTSHNLVVTIGVHICKILAKPPAKRAEPVNVEELISIGAVSLGCHT